MRYISDWWDSLLVLSVSSAFGIVIFFLVGSDDPLAVLAISLVIHEFLLSYFFFSDQSRSFSRRLASNEVIILIKSKIGRFATTALCILLPFIISASVLISVSFVVKGSTLDALDYWSNGYQRFLMMVILLGLLIDPVAYIFFEKNFGDSWTYIFGYLSILMVAIGSVSGRSGESIFLVALLVALLNVRQTFVFHFHYNEDNGISFLAPSMFALFVALLPNLLLVLEILEV